jgi:DNA-binding cell septation regulator SpoVG
MSSITDVKLYTTKGNSAVKANGSFVYNGAFEIKFSLLQGPKGLFVGLPGESYVDKEGQKKWASKVKCVNDDITKEIQKAILKHIHLKQSIIKAHLRADKKTKAVEI